MAQKEWVVDEFWIVDFQARWNEAKSPSELMKHYGLKTQEDLFDLAFKLRQEGVTLNNRRPSMVYMPCKNAIARACEEIKRKHIERLVSLNQTEEESYA